MIMDNLLATIKEISDILSVMEDIVGVTSVVEDTISEATEIAANEEENFTGLLFQGIENMPEIKQLMLNGEFEAAVINPELIYHPCQLTQASVKTLISSKRNQLKTKSLYAELLYNLHPSRSIRDAIEAMGVQDEATEALFAVYGKRKGTIDLLNKYVKGNVASADKIASLRNVDSIKKLYKIKDCLTDDEKILAYILTVLSCKEV
ncbi:hypothetical protein CDAR_4321 [Caerostris darwini]|uniref:Uncharacterized protein n=1 Tax=Caerostris darwini TaxID=1538125 RepID=A0AAV4X0G4_9ARAC|nr:hypothetical protein CDAR_4321 [Caerostris darwini]